MTVSQAIRLANRRGFASADFDLENHARYVALPQFIRDLKMVIGLPYWARKTASFTFTTATTLYNLPTDFSRFEVLHPVINGQLGEEMIYGGETPDKLLAAEFATASAPCAYFVVHGSGESATKFQLKLAAPVDATYPARGVYSWAFPTSTLDPEMDDYMPADMQGLFSQKLRCDILLDAFGEGDTRYNTENAAYQAGIETLFPFSEASRKRAVKYVR